MAVKVTLDSIRAAIEQKFQTFDVPFGDQVLILENPMRLSDDQRSAMVEVSKVFSKDKEEISNDDLILAFSEVLTIAAKDEGVASDFLTEVAKSGKTDEMLILSEVFTSYMDDQQVGEA